MIFSGGLVPTYLLMQQLHLVNTIWGVIVPGCVGVCEAAQAQRLIVMADGHIIDDGAPTEVFQHVDTLRNAGLAVPETVGLLYELRKEGLNVPLDAISDEACAAVLAGLLL